MAENNPPMPDVTGIPNKEIRFAIRATVAGQAHLSYLFYGADQDLDTQAELTQAIVDVWASVTPQWTDCVTADWVLHSIVARRVDQYGMPSYFMTGLELAATLPTVGTVAGDSCPPQDAVVIRKRTRTPGKRGRGRWFISGVAEGDQVAGTLTAAALLKFRALALALAAPISGATGVNYQPMHCYWRETPNPATVILQGEYIESTDVDPTIRSQRRRQVGAGI